MSMSAAPGRSQASSHRSPQGEGTPVSAAPAVAVVGAGNMGGAMVERLREAGWPVAVCDIDPVRQRQRMFFKGFENPLVAVHSVRETTVVIDAAGQVFTIAATGKPVKAGGQSGYPCCSWIARSGEASVFIAQRGGMIHRIPIIV